MTLLFLKIFIFTVLWVFGGQALTHWLYPEMWETEQTREALPWLLFLGYGVGTVAMGVSDVIIQVLKSRD